MSEGMEGVWHKPPALDNTKPEDSHLKIKGSLISKDSDKKKLWHIPPNLDDNPEEIKSNPEVIKDESSFVCAAILNVENDEDAPPIAKKITESTSLIFVADGLGGSGSRKTKTGETTAYHASRAAQEVIASLSNSELDQELSQIKSII